MLSKPVFCKIPRIVDADVYGRMEFECYAIQIPRLDELLDLIPARKNEWTDHLDVDSFEEAKKKFDSLSTALQLAGGRGIELAELVDAASYRMDMLEFDAKAKFLGGYLRNQLRDFLAAVVDEDATSHAGVSIIDLDHQSPWVFLAVDEDSPHADSLRLLDRSHVCRVDKRSLLVEELTTEFSVDRNYVERMLSEHFEQLPLEELLYKAQEFFDRVDLLEAAAAVEHYEEE